MRVIGIALILVGLSTALLVWRHDLRRLRIWEIAPQAAPRRIAPEIHVLTAGLTGVGCWLLWSVPAALGAIAVHLTLAYAFMPRLLDRVLDARGGQTVLTHSRHDSGPASVAPDEVLLSNAIRCGKDVIGYFVLTGADFVWWMGDFAPGPDFEKHRERFARAQARDLEAQDDECSMDEYGKRKEAWKEACDEIDRLGLSYGDPPAPIQDFSITSDWKAEFKMTP